LRERREAQALQDALERYERALDSGVAPGQALDQARAGTGELSRSLAIATSLADGGAQVTPDAAFVRRVAAQLRTAQVVRKPTLRRAPRFSFAPLSFAAAAIAAALVLIPSFRSIPGQPLYAVKGMAEDARVWFASGQGEARIRLAIANTRFEEVERLIDRSRVQVMGGPGLVAVSIADIDDPELALLIEHALQDAGEQLEAAAVILTESPAPQEDIEALVEVTQRGRTLSSDVAAELPHKEQSPVLQSGVKFAKIEAKAKAAQQNAVAPEPTPSVCDTPTPTPTASPTPAESEPTPSGSPAMTEPPADGSPSPSPSPTASAEPTPCTSPDPTPTPTPTPQPEESTEPSPTSSETEQSSTTDDTPDESQQPSNASQSPEPAHRSPLSPFGQRA
jgi:hypothetical protein